MKRFSKIGQRSALSLPKLILAASLILTALPAFHTRAAEIDYGYVSKSGTGSTLASVIFPAPYVYGNQGKSIRLMCLDVRSDLDTATLKLYGGTARATVNATGATGQAVIEVLNSGTITTNDIVVVEKATTGATFRGQVSTVASFTNITLAVNLTFAVAAGDFVFRMSDVRTLQVASTNEIRLASEALFAAALRKPLLISRRPTPKKRQVSLASLLALKARIEADPDFWEKQRVKG